MQPSSHYLLFRASRAGFSFARGIKPAGAFEMLPKSSGFSQFCLLFHDHCGCVVDCTILRLEKAVERVYRSGAVSPQALCDASRYPRHRAHARRPRYLRTACQDGALSSAASSTSLQLPPTTPSSAASSTSLRLLSNSTDDGPANARAPADSHPVDSTSPSQLRSPSTHPSLPHRRVRRVRARRRAQISTIHPARMPIVVPTRLRCRRHARRMTLPRPSFACFGDASERPQRRACALAGSLRTASNSSSHKGTRLLPCSSASFARGALNRLNGASERPRRW